MDTPRLEIVGEERLSFDGWSPRGRLLTHFFSGITAGGEDVRVDRRRQRDC